MLDTRGGEREKVSGSRNSCVDALTIDGSRKWFVLLMLLVWAIVTHVYKCCRCRVHSHVDVRSGNQVQTHDPVVSGLLNTLRLFPR